MDDPPNGKGFNTQVYESKDDTKRVVDDMDNDARYDATCTPIEPTYDDAKSKGADNLHQRHVKQSENNSSNEDSQPRTAPRLEQTCKKNTTKSNFFYNGDDNAAM